MEQIASNSIVNFQPHPTIEKLEKYNSKEPVVKFEGYASRPDALPPKGPAPGRPTAVAAIGRRQSRMPRLSSWFYLPALTGLLLSCGQEIVGPDDELNIAQAASSSAQKPAQERWVSDYVPPLKAEPSWANTYRCTYAGAAGDSCDLGDEFTSMIVGEETVPYQTGALTGVRVRPGPVSLSEEVIYVARAEEEEGKLLYSLTWYVGGELYYRSTDCALTKPPPQAALGSFVDGMILDNSGTEYAVKDDQTACVRIDGRTVRLMQIQDVRVGGKKHANALLIWALAPPLPFPGFDPAGRRHLEQELGITLPTASDTRGWAMDAVLIYGREKGILALVDIGMPGGAVGDIWEVVRRPGH